MIYADADPSDPASWLGYWTIHLDLLVTRRKLFHVVTDPQGIVAFKAREVSACFRYLLEQEVSAYKLQLAPDRTGKGPSLTFNQKEH